MKKQFHHDLIIAWAKGEEIQVYNPHENEWIDAPCPAWHPDFKYRIKPVASYQCGTEVKVGDFVSWKETSCDKVTDVGKVTSIDSKGKLDIKWFSTGMIHDSHTASYRKLHLIK